MAFEEEGFCVVRGPDLLWGGDIKRFHPPAGVFGGVIGGPPCQAFSRLQALVAHNRKKHPGKYKRAENLIPEFERCIREAQPIWFLMENVIAAPLPEVGGYNVQEQLLNNRWVGGVQNRKRRFSFGWKYRGGEGYSLNFVKQQIPRFEIVTEALESAEWEPAVCASGGAAPVPVKIGGSGKIKRTFTERHKATRKGASAMGFKTMAYLRDALRLQGLQESYLDSAPFTVAGKIKAVGNGVPLPMGRAVAKAVRKAMENG